MRTLPALLITLMACAVASPLALADITVNTVTGNDATCADNGPACATLPRAAEVANATPGATRIVLPVGTYPVTRPVFLWGNDRIVGAGGLQSYVRMDTNDADVVLHDSAVLAGVAIGGSPFVADAAHPWPNAWVAAYDASTVQDTTVVRQGQGGGITARGPNVVLRRVMVAIDPGQAGGGDAVSAMGNVAIIDSTFSGRSGVLVQGEGPAGSVRAPALRLVRSVVFGGLRQYSGDALVANSLVVGASSGMFEFVHAVSLTALPLNPTEPRTARLQFVLSTAWQPDCLSSPFDVARGDVAINTPSLVVAGSLGGGSCATGLAPAAVHARPLGAANAIYQVALARPYLVYANASRNAAGVLNPNPAPCCLWMTQDPPPLLGTDPVVRHMPNGVGAVGAGDFVPMAGSPLLHAATDPLSAQVASIYGAALDGAARPAANQTMGAFEQAGVDVALPVPVGIGPVPAPEGGWAPAGSGIPGAVGQPGAPVAGQFDPNVPPIDERLLTAGSVGIDVSVPAKSKVTAPLKVTVTSDRAARVVVVVRRPVMGASGVVGSRVLGKAVTTFGAAGTKVVKVTFKASTQRGAILVGATGRTSGVEPGMDTANSFLTGPAPVVLTAPSSVRAGSNTVTVRVNRTGNVVLVGRTATGRVLGRTSFTATGRGTRKVALSLGPSRLVTGVVTLSAKVAGGEPVTITRPTR